jgi:hypothetical protein
MDPICATPSARHLGDQFAPVLEKFKCRQRRSIVSCTPHQALHCGHSKCCPGTCSSRSSKRFGSPSKRHSATRHCCVSPSAAVKSSSSVILSYYCSPPSLKTQIPWLFPTKIRKAFALDSSKRGTSAGAVERKMQLPRQRGAKPAQERNEIIGRGPPPAGRMPFMSDSFLNRRSVALPGYAGT